MDNVFLEETVESQSMVVYKATCKCCNMVYIGNTQQKLKTRMTQHFGEVRDLIKLGKSSDTFAYHFAQHIDPNLNSTINIPKIRGMVKMDVLWQGDPISCMKSFGTHSCTLCMQERIEILKQDRKDPNSLINSNTEIYGACRHKTRFHRYLMDNSNHTYSTDDGQIPEKVEVDLKETNSRSEDEICTIVSDITI